MRRANSLFVTEEDRALLLSWLASPALAASTGRRARIILGSASGEGARQTARALGVSVETVYLWRRRFQERGIEGLRARALPGRRSQIEARRTRAILRAARARDAGGRPRSVASVARAAGVSRATVRRLWEQHGVRREGEDPTPAGGAPLGAPLQPSSIVGIFIDLPFRALARVVPSSASMSMPMSMSMSMSIDRADRGDRSRSRPAPAGARAGDAARGNSVLLLTALEAFSGRPAARAATGRWDEGALGALLDALSSESSGPTFEILAGPRSLRAPKEAARLEARRAEVRARARSLSHARLIRARTQGEWLSRATSWLVAAPRDQEPALAAAFGHLMDYFAAWSEESGPFVWTPGFQPEPRARPAPTARSRR